MFTCICIHVYMYTCIHVYMYVYVYVSTYEYSLILSNSPLPSSVPCCTMSETGVAHVFGPLRRNTAASSARMSACVLARGRGKVGSKL